jgi:hypothetical protein
MFRIWMCKYGMLHGGKNGTSTSSARLLVLVHGIGTAFFPVAILLEKQPYMIGSIVLGVAELALPYYGTGLAQRFITRNKFRYSKILPL